MAEKTENQNYCSLKKAEKLRRILQETEESDGHIKPFSGSRAYPGFIRAVYRGRVQMGFEDENKKTV